MKILHRYMAREFLTPFIYCLGGFTAIYVLFELFGSFSRLMDSKIPFPAAARYFMAYLSPYVMWLVPAALMLATLYTMWNLCRHCEIIAMRSNGVSFSSIAMPILAIAVLSAAGVAAVNEIYVPGHAQWAKTLRNERFDLAKAGRMGDIVYGNTESGRVWTAEGFDANPVPTFTQVKVTIDGADGRRSKSILSPAARYLDGEWWFSEPTVRHYGENGEEMADPSPEPDKRSMRVFPELDERPSDILMQNRDWRYSSVRDKFRELRQTKRTATPEQKRSMKYDAWAQLLSPFACIVMTLFAIPAGISSSRQSVFKGILGALGMFFAFYALTITSMCVVDRGLLEPITGAVLPHAVFFTVGFLQFRKVR